tara:strand:+ start:169 stop:714 length:546 start_codon:yes stop_codon:yes gene_type:complete
MDHLEAIMELKNITHPDFNRKIIDLIKIKSTKKLTVIDGVNKNIRDVNGYTLNFDTPTNIFYFNVIKREIMKLYLHYKTKFPQLRSEKLNQIDLLKYNVGGKYTTHVDQFTTEPRHLSIIINLNEDYEGGDLMFTNQKGEEIKKIKLKTGSVIFFPSNFMYPHSIKPITKGIRYSIVAWLQ